MVRIATIVCARCSSTEAQLTSKTEESSNVETCLHHGACPRTRLSAKRQHFADVATNSFRQTLSIRN